MPRKRDAAKKLIEITEQPSLAANDYMRRALSTALLERPLPDQLMNAVLGIAGEAGEIADMIKKSMFHGEGHELNHTRLKLELGDLQWYIILACWAEQISLSDIMSANLNKLANRYPGGKFSAERSANRDSSDV
jgi:NTP pyrophosphatase (non-canonical NTP hydrolase)